MGRHGRPGVYRLALQLFCHIHQRGSCSTAAQGLAAVPALLTASQLATLSPLAGDWHTTEVEMVSPRVAYMLAKKLRKSYKAEFMGMVEACFSSPGVNPVSQRSGEH